MINTVLGKAPETCPGVTWKTHYLGGQFAQGKDLSQKTVRHSDSRSPGRPVTNKRRFTGQRDQRKGLRQALRKAHDNLSGGKHKQSDQQEEAATRIGKRIKDDTMEKKEKKTNTPPIHQKRKGPSSGGGENSELFQKSAPRT